jgi:hypothetical protein
MKNINLVILSVLLSGFCNAATLSFAPASLSVPRGTASSDMTVQVAGDFSTVYVQADVNINLDAFSIYQIQSVGTNLCTLTGGKLRVIAFNNIYLSTPFPSGQYTPLCKLKVRPRSAAGVGGYSLYFSNVEGGNALGNFTSVLAYSATITVTP